MQTVNIVCCTGSTRWREQNRQRNHSVILLMGTSYDSYFKLTAGYITAHLLCVFVVEDAEFNVKELVGLIQTLATAPICHTAGIDILEMPYQPLRQSWHDCSYSSRAVVIVRITSIVLISPIQGAVHLLPLTLQPESKSWNFCNIMDLNTSNVFDMQNVRFDACGIRCSNIQISEACLLLVSQIRYRNCA
jgi:hypothetical protein